MNDLDYRQLIARELLSSGIQPNDQKMKLDTATLLQSAGFAARLPILFPPALIPQPQAIDPEPQPSDPLPKADVVIITWTVDEVRALCDVLTPGVTRDHWYRYARNFAQYLPKIREHAPARNAKRLGSYYLTKIGTKTILCIKSELHLNQDGINNFDGPGVASLPIKDFFHQILDEVQPQHIITTGTAGGVFAEHDLGDVVVTRASQFRLQLEFRNAPFKALVTS
jgi:hypothetical protein